MKHLILILSLILSGYMIGEVNLKCEGGYQDTDIGVFFGEGGTFGNTFSKSEVKSSIVLFSFNEAKNEGKIKVPVEMQPYDLKRRLIKDFVELKTITINENEIYGKVKFPKKLIQGKIRVDRTTGVLTYKLDSVEFSGVCEIFENKKRF